MGRKQAMAAPGGAAVDPYLKGVVRVACGSRQLQFRVPHSVFSSDRLDPGTKLLLDHLPTGEPGTFLDLGCGYGALGLTVAAWYPGAQGLLVDRDLLAVRWAARNAADQGATRATVRGGVGFRGFQAGDGPFDLVLCNVPARVGEQVLTAFLHGGITRLATGGELRIVVIRDLVPAVATASAALGVAARHIAEGDNHVVFAWSAPDPAPTAAPPEPLATYERDTVELALPEPLTLRRPTDLADEPHRLARAIPFLAECMPRTQPRSVLAWRCGYGLLPALLLLRFPEAQVVAADRDLLGLEMTAANGAAAGPRLHCQPAIEPQEIRRDGGFDLVVGELLPALGDAATRHELAQLARLLAKGGSGLLAARASQWRTLERPAPPPRVFPMGTREDVTLLALR